MIFKSKIYLIIPLAVFAFLFLFNVSPASAANCGKNQNKFSFSSFLNPLATLAEKVVKDFGYEITLAAAPDPDNCGSDSVGCSASYTPTATVDWTQITEADYIYYHTVVYSNSSSWTFCDNGGGTCSFSGAKVVRYGADSCGYVYGNFTNSVSCTGSWGNPGPFGASDPCPNIYKHCDYASGVDFKSANISTVSYTFSSGLVNNTLYDWLVEAYYNGGYGHYPSRLMGLTDQPYGSFTTPDCLPPPPEADIKANGSDGPIDILYGAPALITWCGAPSHVCANASACSVSPDGWGGVSGAMSTGALVKFRTYTLSCTGPGGTRTDSVAVNVGPRIAVDFQVDIKADGSDGPLDVSSGGSAEITWCGSPAQSCSGAISCSVFPAGWSGLSGTQSTGNLTSSQTYTLNCAGAAGGLINDSEYLTAIMLSQSGMGGFNAQNIVDYKPGTNGWYTDYSTPPGAWLKIDLREGKGRNYVKARIYADRAGDKGNYSIQYSDTGGSGDSEWKNAATGFILSLQGWNEKTWSDVGIHRYWRLYLTTRPGIGAWLTELELYKQSASDSVTINLGSLPIIPINSTYVISPPSAAIEINKTQQFSGWYDPDGPSGSQAQQKVTGQAAWTSSNTAIAAINTLGLAACQANGSAIITSVYTPLTIPATGNKITATANLTCAAISAPPIPAPALDLKINDSIGPITISYNTPANITWSSANANSCNASGGTWAGLRPVSGSESTGNLTVSQTYTLTCTGSGGTVQKNVIVNVSAPLNFPTLDFNVSISAGNSVGLSWSSVNTTSCNASGAWYGSKPVSGSESAGIITDTKTYTMSCAGPNGTAQSSVTVNKL